MSVNYSLKLISGYNVITLPSTIQNLKSIKIKKLMYRFISMDQYVFTVNIATWNANIHFDGLVQYNYTLVNYNDGNINKLLHYENMNGNNDVSFEYGRGLSQIIISMEVDGIQCADITQQAWTAPKGGGCRLRMTS